MPAAAASLRRRRRRARTIEDVVDTAFEWEFGGITLGPQQVRSELVTLGELVAKRAPRVLLEIGAARGATVFVFTTVAPAGATLVTMDIGSAAWRSLFYASFAVRGQKVRLVRGDSHDPATYERARELLDGKPVDFLFIDGDHSYEGVKRDFELYSPLVRRPGAVALHDIVPGPAELVGGVPRFWQELKQRGLPAAEIVESWDQGGFGIGVVTLDDER